MSMYNALGDSHQQGNQGWSYSSSCNQTSGAFSSPSSTSGREQPSGSSVEPQCQILSALLNSSAPSDRYGQPQLQETQASQKEKDGLLLDEPGMVIGEEEAILRDNSPVAGTGYHTSVNQNQQILPSDMHSAYINKTGHSQFLQGSTHMSTLQEFGAQQDLVNPPQSILSYGQENYNSACHPRLQRIQPPYMQQQGMGQQSHGPLQQNHRQHQGNLGQQSHSLQQHGHLQGQPQQLQAATQQSVAQHSQPGQQQTPRQHALNLPHHHQQMASHDPYVGGQMNTAHGQQIGVSQQPLGQLNQPCQQVDVNHTPLKQTLGQQHSVSQHPHSQQPLANHQPLIGQQSNIQVNHLNQNTPRGHLRLVNMLNEAPSSSHSSGLTGQNVQFVSGNKTMFIQQQPQQNRHTFVIHRLPQNVISLQTQQPMQSQQFSQNQMLQNHHNFHNQQSVSRLTHNSQLPFQNQLPVHSQQSMPNQLSLSNHQNLQTQQTLQHQSNLQNQHSMQSNPPPLIDVANQQQSYDPSAGYTGQLHGQRLTMDQHQQQQQVCVQQQQQQACSQQQQAGIKQEQQEGLKQQGLLLVVHPSPAVSGSRFVSSHHNAQQLPLQQPPQNVVKASVGSPLAHNMPNSPQLTPQTPAQSALNSSPQLSVQKSPQLSLQSSPQLSLQNSPQQFSLQGSPNTLQSSAQILMLHTPQLTQSKPQISLQNVSQIGHLPQLNCSPHVQNSHQVLQVQNVNQVLHIQNTPQTVQLSGNGLSQRPFQVSQQPEVNQTGGNQLTGQNTDRTVTSSGKGRGQSRAKANHGGRGGRGGRGRGSANSATGLHMAPDHFRPDPAYPPVLESLGVEPAVSHAENPEHNQEQGIQELSMPTPKSEPSNNSPLEATHMPGLNSYSPPSVSSSSVPRLSATNEVWPTPMPSIKQEQSGSPPALVVESLSSSSQQSSDCPVFSPSSYLEDIKPSPPVAPLLPAVSAPEVTSPPAQVQPTKPVVPKSPEQKPELAPPKRKLAEDEEGTAVCKYCGYCSNNFEVCVGCKRKLPADVKVMVKKRKKDNADQDERERTCGGGKVNSAPSAAGSSMNRRTLYANKQQTQGTGFAGMHQNLSSDVPGKNMEPSTHTRRRGSGRGGYRGKKPKEPVTVTISSDEDEDPSSDNSQRLPMSSAVLSLNTPDEDDGFFSAPVTKPNTFGTSRRNKMLDASGQCVPHQQVASLEGIFFEVRGVRIGSMRTSGLEVRFRARSITFRVKSDTTQQELEFFLHTSDLTWIKFSFSPSQPVLFIKVTPECGMRLRTLLKMAPDSPELFDPSSQDTQQNMIVVIVDTMLDEPGLRQILQLYSQVHSLSDFLQEINYDSANDLLVKSTPPVITPCPGELLLRGYNKIRTAAQSLPTQVVNDKGDHVPSGEGQSKANGPISVGRDLNSDVNETMNSLESRDSRSPSPRTGFVGPIERILSYPPPPAKGAITITNEDLFCLTEGEFLNDVILDFYLKYLFREKLSEADQQRTHIFSSFFFKRLTQRQSKSTQDEEEEKMTAPQRRHSRVKTWTRHVDIFSKDFLLIPINEKAHWFLAVVCFPGMMAQEQISYQPASSPFYEELEASGDASASTPTQQAKGSAADDSSQDTLPDTTTPSTSSKGDHVLGKVISAETAKKEKSMYNLGLRQACILIMDSLMGPSRNGVIRILKEYLQVEWDLKKGRERNMLKTVRGGCPKVPQQTNYSDCGVFVLQYAESFFENPIASFSIPMKLESWFPLGKVERKREEIRSLILRLQTEANR